MKPQDKGAALILYGTKGNIMRQDLSIKTRITLHTVDDKERLGFGRGIELLLEGIKEYGSLNRTAKELGMAYSKAWNILRTVEQKLEVQLINRDGAHGSTLTADGEMMLARYQEMLNAAETAAQEVFNKYFA